MYCKKCGEKIDDDSIFCSHCGERCVVEQVKTEEVNKKFFGESFLRVIDRIIIIFFMVVGTIALFFNTITGIVVIVVSVLLNAYVLNDRQIAKIKALFPNPTEKILFAILVYILIPVVIFGSAVITNHLKDIVNPSSEEIAIEYAEESINSYGSDSVTDKQSKVEYSFEYNDYDYYKIVVKYKKDNSTSTYSQTLYIKVSQTNHQPSQVSEHQFNNLKNSSNANK